MPVLQAVRIGDLGRVVTGKTPPSSQPELFGTQHPFLTPTDIDGFARHIEPSRYLSSDGQKHLYRLMLPERAVCVVCIGATIGKVCMTDRLSFTNQQINSIIVNEGEHDPFFVYHLLTTLREELKSNAGGAATPIINKTAFSEIEVRVPVLSVQRRIASILSAYDDLIENSQRRIKILESMARALYREWFVHFRFPGHENHPRVASPLGDIPEGWEIKKLGELISIDKGVSYNGAGLTENGNPMVNLKNILAGGGFRRDATKPYSGDFKHRHTVKPGDIILANTDLTQAGNVVASAAMVPRFADMSPILISHHLFAVRLPAELPAVFIYHLLLEDAFRGFAKGYAIGTTVLGLPKEGVLNFAFVMPPENLIGDFVRQVAPLHQLVEATVERVENLRRTRDLLLPRLLSGLVNLADN